MSPRALAVLAAASLAITVLPNARAQVLSYRLPADLDDAPERERPPADDLALVQRDDWLGRDKAYHAGATFGLTLGAHVALTEGVGMEREAALPFAAMAVLGVGLAKEVADSRRAYRPLFSWKDLAADAFGAAVGVAVVSLSSR
ncbi:MAG TPA: hypothetical protein EYQ24_10680 [Bacteroidetes bacterium]|nr:hypothetical protein [Bacteroidota bacterium]HIL57496.1 hypothetical protein [Rhodothermales bacterium]